MIEFFLILLRLLCVRDPVAATHEAMRFFLGSLLARLEDPETLLLLQTDPRERAHLEAAIASAEDGINLIIHHRARQLLGLRFIHIRPNAEHPPRCARSLADVLARFERAVSLYENIERLAQRRAARMKREMQDNPLAAYPPSGGPLRLDASHRSTSPPSAVEDFAPRGEVLPQS